MGNYVHAGLEYVGGNDAKYLPIRDFLIAKLS